MSEIITEFDEEYYYRLDNTAVYDPDDFDKVYTYKDVPPNTLHIVDIDAVCKSQNEKAFNREYNCKYETV